MFTLFRFSLIATFLAFGVSAAMGQQIQGQVRFADSGRSVLGALVRCDGTGGVSDQMTDRNGKFLFYVSPGHYTVTVRAAGFIEEQQQRDLLDKGQSEFLFFTLKPAPISPSVARGKPKILDSTVPADAEKEFEKAEEVLASQQKNRLPEAIKHLERAVKLYSPFLQAQLLLGTLCMELEQWGKAEQAFNKAFEIDPKGANPLFALGEIYLRQKKYAESEKVLLQGLAIDDRSWGGHFTLARVYSDEGDLSRAGRQVGLAIQLNSVFADAYLLAGNILLRANKPDDALANFERYLLLAPNGKYAAQAKEEVKKLRRTP